MLSRLASSAPRATRAASSARCFSTDNGIPTPLNAWHKSLGGNMVPFAGYELPVLYKKDNGGVLAEHHQTRERAGLFDVSHMGQINWHGKDAADFIETVVCGDIKGLAPGTGLLSLIMNEEGGIMDDSVISRVSEADGGHIYMVSGGGTIRATTIRAAAISATAIKGGTLHAFVAHCML